MESSTLQQNKKQDWGKIIKFSVIVVVVLGITKVLLQLFVAAGPLFKGLEDILGAGANIVEGFTNGCSVQPDCSQTTDATVCKNQYNCGWNTPSKSDEEATCINMSGRPSGSGGFFSAGCGLGIGAILYGCGILFTGFITLLAAGFSRNKNVETAGRLNLKGTAETLKDTVGETKKGVEKIKTDADKEGKPLTDDQIELTAKLGANSVSLNKALESTVGQKDAQELSSKALVEANKINDKTMERAQEQMTDSEIEEVENRADKEFDPLELTAINTMSLLGIVPSKNVHTWLYGKMLQKPHLFSQTHRDFLNYYKKVL
jgi:hypothetical protein